MDSKPKQFSTDVIDSYKLFLFPVQVPAALRLELTTLLQFFIPYERIRLALRWDFRNTVPRFDVENRKTNQALVDLITEIATQKEVSPAQIALAWLLAQKPWIVPIPGTTKLNRFNENIGSVDVHLTAGDLKLLEDALTKIQLTGDRYSEASAKMIDR